MKVLYLLLISSATSVDSFGSKSAFFGRHGPVLESSSAGAGLRMDLELSSSIDLKARYSLEQLIQENLKVPMTLDEAEALHGMPWKSSIDPKATEGDLLYTPFWTWQLSFMKENLSNLRVMPCTDGKTDFSYIENSKKKARMVNMCLTSSEYRKIRLTYYDAGDSVQVFNSVWYPDPKHNLPILGIDLLAFNRKKYLAIVDFQPLHANENDHARSYEELLKPIKEKYESLKGRMSSKFYDETQFFSQQMLFARFEDEEIISRELFPAFQSYVQTHLDLIKSTVAEPSKMDAVLRRQRAYDTYSAERDPAMGLFTAMFGEEWATEFVHSFLFSMSERKPSASSPSIPFMGSGGPPVQVATVSPSSTLTQQHSEMVRVPISR